MFLLHIILCREILNGHQTSIFSELIGIHNGVNWNKIERLSNITILENFKYKKGKKGF